MTPDERDRVMARLLAIWPNPTMGDATRIVWNEFLVGLSGPRSLRALDTLQRTSRHRPAQSDFWECYLAERPDASGVLPGPECFVCTDGWVGDGPVSRCPNGCLPPTAEQRRLRQMAEEQRWDEEHAKRRAEVVR